MGIEVIFVKMQAKDVIEYLRSCSKKGLEELVNAISTLLLPNTHLVAISMSLKTVNLVLVCNIICAVTVVKRLVLAPIPFFSIHANPFTFGRSI